MTHSVTISIGGLAIGVSVSDAALADRVQARYRAFSIDHPAPFVTSVQARPSATTLTEYPIEFHAGVLRFTHSHCHGYIDVAGQRAELTTTTAQPLNDVEYFLRAAVAVLAFDSGGLMLHAAGLDYAGRGYAFFGHSGSGKTTVSRVSKQARVLNDDLVVLRPADTGWTMHATPFSNPTQFAPTGPHAVPLSRLLRLVQARQVRLETLPTALAVAEVIASIPIVPLDPDRRAALLARLEQLIRQVPTSRLHFLPDDSFWPSVAP